MSLAELLSEFFLTDRPEPTPAEPTPTQSKTLPSKLKRGKKN